jgi:hypothetical protein
VADVPESQSANIRNRSYTIGAQVDIPDGGAEGVLFAHGSRFGGHALYIKYNRLHYAYNFVGSFEQQVVATEDVPAALLLLGRKDVVVPGGLRVRKAVQAAYRLDHLPTQQEVLAIADKWRPYRSLATSYLFTATFAQAKTPPATPRKT